MTSADGVQLKHLRVAIVHNWFFKMRGGERVVKSLCELFPQADLYALFGDDQFVAENFAGHVVSYTWLNRLPWISRIYKSTLPFWPMAIESLKLRDYDLVISTSASVPKGAITPVGTVHISYVFTPMRYLWDQKDLYLSKYSRLRRVLVAPVLNYLRIWDVTSSKRPDYLIAVSDFIRRRMQKFYGRGSDAIIYPPVSLDKCYSASERSNFYLSLSSFEENKGAEDAIEVAIKHNLKLKLTGEGKTKRRLEKKYTKYTEIEFLGWVSEDEKYKLLSEAKGLFFLGEEDFGIVAVEAIASGCPVIAYDKGAIREIEERVGGVVYLEDSTEFPLKEVEFNEEGLAAFSEESFKQQIEEFVMERVRSGIIRSR